MSPPPETSKRRLRRRMGVLAIATAILLYLGHLGYLGGEAITEIEASPHGHFSQSQTAAVLLSGDMGFTVGMGPEIASRLAADGIPVVAVNSLTYFRYRRTPHDAVQLVHDALKRAQTRFRADRVLLIGQSYGADMLHVGLAGLDPASRRKVAMIALVVPERTVEFRASPSEIFSLGEAAVDALPTARQLGWAPTLCIYGAEETRSLCPLLAHRPVRLIVLPGGHPLHHDADALYAALGNGITAILGKSVE